MNNGNNFSVKALVDKFGKDRARKFLLRYFSDPTHLWEFASLFPDHIQYDQPDWQREIFDTIGRAIKNNDDAAVAEAMRLLVLAPRGSGKSTVANIVILSWFALYARSRFTILLSDTSSQAELQLNALASELSTNPKIRWLFGDVMGDSWNVSFIIIHSPFGDSAIVARGAGQKIRGLKWRSFRPELVIIDDLENDEAVSSVEQRQKLENWFRFSLLRALKRGAMILYIGTVLHDRALLRRIQNGEAVFGRWNVLRYNAIKADGTSFWEKRFPIAYLESIRDNPNDPEYIGSLVFAQEMMHEPASEADRIIQTGWIRYYNHTDFPEEWYQKLEIFGGIDPAIDEDNKKASSFVFVTIGVDSDGHIWVLQIIRKRQAINAQIEDVMDGYERWHHKSIGSESIAYQRVLAQLIRTIGAQRGVYPRVKEIMTDKSKSRRMVLHSSKFEGGFIHLDKSDPETPNLVEELIRFPAEPNDAADGLMLALETIQRKVGRAFTKKPSGLA